MFPFCLINASVTDAGGIRSRLVSFPPALFSSVCHIAFPMVLFKKQTGSAFPVFLLTQPLLFSCCFCQIQLTDQNMFFPLIQLTGGPQSDVLKCQTAQSGQGKSAVIIYTVDTLSSSLSSFSLVSLEILKENMLQGHSFDSLFEFFFE